MRHEAGLEHPLVSYKAEDLTIANIKENKIGKLIEADYSQVLGGYKRMYHAASRDILANEVFRRVEPQGRTMHEYMQQELTKKLGPIDVHFAVEQHVMDRVRDAPMWGMLKSIVNMCCSEENGNIHGAGFWATMGVVNGIMSKFGELGRENRKSATELFYGPGENQGNQSTLMKWKVAEVASCIAFASSRGCAKIASIMGNHGRFMGQ